MIIKICGITTEDDALWAANLGADLIGFIFVPESKRRVTVKRARQIVAGVPPFVKKVGVFAGMNAPEVEKIAQDCGLQYLQFHGEEPPEYCAGFSGRYTVIKAVRVRDEESVRDLGRYQTDYLLLDTFVEDAAGGTGRTFDWGLAARAKECGVPVILSGGLTPENVAEAIKKVQPAGVDVSSGIEERPGKKDYDLMKEFIARARR